MLIIPLTLLIITFCTRPILLSPFLIIYIKTWASDSWKIMTPVIFSVFSGLMVPGQMAKLTYSEGRLANDQMFGRGGGRLGKCTAWLFETRAVRVEKSMCKYETGGRTQQFALGNQIADGDIFPDTRTLLNIGCILPVASSEVERSYSGLRRIKSYMRSTMNEDRLAALVLMHIMAWILT